MFALEYVLLGAVLLNEHVSATLVSACGTLTLLFTARKKQGRVVS